MGKLIDRDVLVDHLRRMMEARQIDRLPRSGYAKAIQDIDGCPTAEPKRGRWIPHPGEKLWDVCTACGIGCKRREEYDGAEIEYSYLYCPNCGARMDGDSDGQEG